MRVSNWQVIKKCKMGLDIYLRRKRWISYDAGKTSTEDHETVYAANITHNLIRMASEAGIYKAIWAPEEIGKTKAGEIVTPLKRGLAALKKCPHCFEPFNSPNGYGTYYDFVPFVERYLEACERHPDTIIDVSR